MLKICFIGAGSIVFAETVLTDLLTFPAITKDLVISLEDIDPKRLDMTYNLMRKYKDSNPKEYEGVSIEKTTDQRKAIEGSKYVINAIQVGGLEGCRLDIEIPYKYGVTQNVGDTLGPGGVFRFLRTAPVMKSILEDMQDEGYHGGDNIDKALLLNYTNPMAMVTWYCNKLVPDSTVGLCHGVQHTAALISASLDLKVDQISYLCAGINHMAWYLEIWYKTADARPIWRDAYPLFKNMGEIKPNIVEIEKLRFDMMKATGYFMTESSGHLSEYIPYYRKRKDLLEKYSYPNRLFSSLKHAEYYELENSRYDSIEKDFDRKLKRKEIRLKKKSSEEFAAPIINAIESDMPFRFNGNVVNKEGGLITNLPKNCCVEVPVFADAHGLHPQGGIELPTICQALCMSNIMVQKAAVEGALELNKEKVYHAVLLDPNAASVCSPGEIRKMVDEMFKEEAKWLPQFS